MTEMNLNYNYMQNDQTKPLGFLQVVMPTVEADVAFGLGKFNLGPEEVRFRVSKALNAVGMSDYLQVGLKISTNQASVKAYATRLDTQSCKSSFLKLFRGQFKLSVVVRSKGLPLLVL